MEIEKERKKDCFMVFTSFRILCNLYIIFLLTLYYMSECMYRLCRAIGIKVLPYAAFSMLFMKRYSRLECMHFFGVLPFRLRHQEKKNIVHGTSTCHYFVVYKTFLQTSSKISKFFGNFFSLHFVFFTCHNFGSGAKTIEKENFVWIYVDFCHIFGETCLPCCSAPIIPKSYWTEKVFPSGSPHYYIFWAILTGYFPPSSVPLSIATYRN